MIFQIDMKGKKKPKNQPKPSTIGWFRSPYTFTLSIGLSPYKLARWNQHLFDSSSEKVSFH